MISHTPGAIGRDSVTPPEAIRRVERKKDADPQQGGARQHPHQQPPAEETPHDIVELSRGAAPAEPGPLPLLPAVSAAAPARHLDLEV